MHHALRSVSSRYCTLAFAAALTTLAPLPTASADVVLEITPVSINTSGPLAVQGSFSILARLTGGTPAPALAGYQVVLSATPVTGLRLTGLSITSASDGFPPVFGDRAPTPITIGGTLLRLDNLLPTGTSPLDSGDGLAKVFFEIDPGTVADFTLTFATNPQTGTILSDGLGNPIPYTATTGTLRAFIPEPASLSSLALAMPLMLRRRRVA